MTETVLVDETGDALATLGELRALGVRIAMDDFGTGYSSLAYLQRFPFDGSRSTARSSSRWASTPNTRAIVRAMVQVGRSLAIQICAEGVETPLQLAQLRNEGCHEAQGFLFAPPVPGCDGRRHDGLRGCRRTDACEELPLATARRSAVRRQRRLGALPAGPGRSLAASLSNASPNSACALERSPRSHQAQRRNPAPRGSTPSRPPQEGPTSRLGAGRPWRPAAPGRRHGRGRLRGRRGRRGRSPVRRPRSTSSDGRARSR